MKISIAIMMAILFLMPTVYGTSMITDVRWNANLNAIEILFDKFSSQWGNWKMYVDDYEWPMEGGEGNVTVRPNAPVNDATGLFIGTVPWITSLNNVKFPCCGKIKFQIPGQGFTNEYAYNLAKDGCKTTSPKSCSSPSGSSDAITGFKVVGITVPLVNPTPTPDSGIKLEYNVDRPGLNIRGYNLSSADPQLCANDCAKDTKCQAFTYVKPGFRGPDSKPECWLKNGVPNPVSQEYCISGVKASASVVDWNNIPSLVLHLFHNVNQGDPQLVVKPSKTNLHFFHGGDECASSGEGYSWWMIDDNPNQNAAEWNRRLPSGLVLGLMHSLNQAHDKKTVFGTPTLGDILMGTPANPEENERIGVSDDGAIVRENGGDLCPGLVGTVAGEGYYWYETHNFNFTNWDEAEKNLPKGTILGLKHSTNQPDKTVIWRDQKYDPVKSYRDGSASPPTFIAKNGGDLGGSSGEGYYWFEKTTGPDFFQPRS